LLYVTEFNNKVKTTHQLMRWLKRNKGIKYIVRNNKCNYMMVRKLVKVRGSSFAGISDNNSENEVWTILHHKDTIRFTDSGFIVVSKENAIIDYKFFEQQEYNEEYQKICNMSELEAKSKFVNNEKITGDVFIKLCNSYNIKMPSQTKYWARKCLLTVRVNSEGGIIQCEFKSKHESKTIHEIARKLYSEIDMEV